MKRLTWALASAIVIIYCSVQTYGGGTPMDELSSKYKHAASEKERMNICIEAIGRGIVCRGCTIRSFDALFGTTLSNDIPRPGEAMERGAVNFAVQPSPESDDVAVPYVGWYLAVEFDSAGLIQNYYLSNLHK